MFAVEKWLRQRKVTLYCHNESDTAGAHSREPPDDSYEAKHPNVLLVEHFVDVRANSHLRQHSHQTNKVQRH